MIGKVVSFILWGSPADKSQWQAWFEDVKGIVEKLGLEFTHFGIESESYDTPKIVTIKRRGKKLLETLKNDKNIEWLDCYVLPDNYRTAVFDYVVYCARTQECVIMTVDESLYSQLDKEEILKILKKYTDYVDGEINSMARSEVPLMYVEDKEVYESLEIFEKIDV